MQCAYYLKYGFLKRLKGTMGFCELQKCDIIREEAVGKVPFMLCEGIKGKSNTQCGVFKYFAKKENSV